MSIGERLAKGSIWTIAAAVSTNLSTFVVFAVLANVLPPKEFGVVAFGTIFIEVGRVLVVAGISDALVQRRDWSDSVASTAFWINLAVGTLLSILLAAGAGAVTTSYGPRFVWVLSALSLDLIIEGFTAVHVAKLRREFGFKQLALRGMLSRIVSAVVGVAMALMGWGVWALVLSRLIASLGSAFVLLRMSDFRPSFRFDPAHAREFGPFALNQLGSQLLMQANTYAGSLVIGAFLGPVAIAQYQVGTRALGVISSLVISPIQQTALSAFSRLQDKTDVVGPAYLRMTQMAALVACPTMLGVAALSPDLIVLMFGPNWVIASYVLTACSFFIGAATISYFQGPALSGAGNSRLSFYSTLISCIGNIAFALIAAPFGVIWIAVSQTLRPYATLPLNLRLLKSGIGTRQRAVIGAVLPAYACAVLMFAIVTALRIWLTPHVNIFARIALCSVLGVVVYFGAASVFARRHLRDSLGEISPLLPLRARWLLQLI